MILLLACTPSPISLGGDSVPAPPGDSGLEVVPGQTPGEDSADTGSEPDPQLSSPGTATLSCDGQLSTTDSRCVFEAWWPDGTLEVSTGADVRIRGRSSEGFPKHQYGMEFVNDAGEPTSAELFGMGSEGDWVLNGMWIDRAMFRNKLAFDVFRELGGGNDWAPESVYVELTIDGDYVGLYLLNETVDRDRSRLDIAEDDGTGQSFIVAASEDGIYSNVQYGRWEIDYPTEVTGAVQRGVEARLAAWEAEITGRGDPFTEMDLDSFVRFVLVEEFVKNNDGYYLSHRVYAHPDGYLHMVPWDLDLSLGQPSYNDNENPYSWIAYRPAIVADSANDAFHQRFSEMWAEAREGTLATDAVIGRQEALRAHMGEAIDRNWSRWNIEDVDFSGYLYRVSSPEEEYARVATWTEARLDWMDAAVESY